MRRRLGLTLLEVMVAVGIFVVGLAGLYFILDVGSRTFRDAGAGTEARNQAALVMDRLGKLINQSSAFGASASGGAVSLPSAIDRDTGRIAFDGWGGPKWSSYIVVYRDQSEHTLAQNTWAMTTPSSEIVPIEKYDFSSGSAPLEDYCQGGKIIATGVTEFVAEKHPDATISLIMAVEREQKRGRPPAVTEIATRIQMRNR